MQRIAIVGTTGSGKTTLAREVAARLGCPHVELDAVHWGPNWTPSPEPIFRERVTAALAGPTWVVDGNYHAVRDLVWQRADTLIWLDYSLPLLIWRLFRRTGRRILSGEELWNGNRERLDAAFGRDSILLWLFKSYPRRKREYPILLRQPENAHLQVLHFVTPSITAWWLAGLSAPTNHPTNAQTAGLHALSDRL